MANGAFKFKDNSGNVVSHISGSGANIYFSGGTLDLSGMTGLTLGGLTISGSIQNAQTASLAPSYLLTSSFNTYSSSYAITGSNTFIGNQTISGSIIPAVSASYDLGSVNYPFRHLYLSSASLYVNGTKVLGSTAQELQITTDAGQSFKILESSSDTITLQSADGNITLATSGGGDVIMDPTNGVIGLKGTVTVYTGNKVVSSDGNSIQFGNGIAITGSIVSTVTPLVSGSSQIIYSGLTGIPSGIASGSSQIDITGTTGYSTFSSSISTSIGSLSSSVATTTSGLSSTIGSLSSSVATTTSGLSSSVGSLSSSVATTTSGLSSSIGNLSSSVATTTSGLSSSVATTTLGTKNRVDSIEAKTGSYATTGSNIFKDNQTISGSLIVTQNLTVFGSSSITYVTSSQLRVDDNIITLNTSSPGSRFGGLEVYDSGSLTQATGSILWDSVNNRWVYQQSSEATYGGGVLMSGPRSSGSLGSELTLTSGRVAKSAGGDHLNDSNITDDGTLVSINSNTEVTGTLKVTSTITGTLSGNASTATSSSYSSTATSSSYSTTATSSSYSNTTTSSSYASTATSSSYATNSTSSSYANTTTSSSYASTATSSSYAANATSSSYATTAGSAGSSTSSTTAATASYVAGANVSGNITGNAATATSSSYATTAGTANAVAWSNISSTPSVVSGSSQITLSSTTGFGTYLNQAVLSTSSPTFAGLTSSGAATFSSNLTVSGTTILGSYVSSNITLNTDYKIIVRQASMTLDAVTPSWFGYSTGYGIVKLGSTDANRSLAFNVDVSGNPSGAFSGNGSEYVWRNVGSFITPNSGNNGYNTLYSWNSSAQMTFNQNATFSGTMAVNNTATFTVSSGNNLIIEKPGGGAIAYTKSATNSLLLEDDGGKLGVYSWNGSGWSQSASINTGTTIFTCSVSPEANGTRDLGSASYRWSTVYTSDLSLSNGIGDYTIVEGENDLFLYNNKQNKVYKFMLQEVDPNLATPKKLNYEF